MSTRRGVGVGGDTRGIFDDAGPPSCRRVRQADGMIGNFCRDTAGTIGKWHSGQGAGAAGRGQGQGEAGCGGSFWADASGEAKHWNRVILNYLARLDFVVRTRQVAHQHNELGRTLFSSAMHTFFPSFFPRLSFSPF